MFFFRLFLVSFSLLVSNQLLAEFTSDTESSPKGSSVTLTWSSSTSSCTATGAWSGSKSGSGSEQVNLPEEGWNLFTLNCNGVLEYVWGSGT
ncbi:MAG: hypothetical protein ACJ0GU_00310 [Gammaproteobacteria bacterium]|nr:MAG: hypothetical protein EVA53_02135 [Gammaproteobacteria bacterium]